MTIWKTQTQMGVLIYLMWSSGVAGSGQSQVRVCWPAEAIADNPEGLLHAVLVVAVSSGFRGVSRSSPQTTHIHGYSPPSCSLPLPFPLHSPFVPNPCISPDPQNNQSQFTVLGSTQHTTSSPIHNLKLQSYERKFYE